jgi:hypothetical protein
VLPPLLPLPFAPLRGRWRPEALLAKVLEEQPEGAGGEAAVEGPEPFGAMVTRAVDGAD